MGSSAVRNDSDREFVLADAEFERLCRLVKIHTSIELGEGKQDLVYGRLSKRLRALGLTGFSEYCELLDSGDPAEMEQFVNAITTNLTAFFRESHHFDMLTNEMIPALLKGAPNRKLRIWSAGCSTGEEPYSIAMAAKEISMTLPADQIRILATDLDTNVVATAKAGVYLDNRITNLSKARTRKWFVRGSGSHDGQVRVKDELRNMITFNPLNLLKSWPMKGSLDVIFCRNVVIYFNKETQRILFNQFADFLSDDGYLIIGHSESASNVCDRFQLTEKTVYRKIK